MLFKRPYTNRRIRTTSIKAVKERHVIEQLRSQGKNVSRGCSVLRYVDDVRKQRRLSL